MQVLGVVGVGYTCGNKRGNVICGHRGDPLAEGRNRGFWGSSRLRRDLPPAEISVLVSVGSPLSSAKRGQLTGQFHVVVHAQFLWPESWFEA